MSGKELYEALKEIGINIRKAYMPHPVRTEEDFDDKTNGYRSSHYTLDCEFKNDDITPEFIEFMKCVKEGESE